LNDLREIGNEIKIVRGLDSEENFNEFFFDFMVNSPPLEISPSKRN